MRLAPFRQTEQCTSHRWGEGPLGSGESCTVPIDRNVRHSPPERREQGMGVTSWALTRTVNCLTATELARSPLKIAEGLIGFDLGR